MHVCSFILFFTFIFTLHCISAAPGSSGNVRSKETPSSPDPSSPSNGIKTSLSKPSKGDMPHARKLGIYKLPVDEVLPVRSSESLIPTEGDLLAAYAQDPELEGVLRLCLLRHIPHSNMYELYRHDHYKPVNGEWASRPGKVLKNLNLTEVDRIATQIDGSNAKQANVLSIYYAPTDGMTSKKTEVLSIRKKEGLAPDLVVVYAQENGKLRLCLLTSKKIQPSIVVWKNGAGNNDEINIKIPVIGNLRYRLYTGDYYEPMNSNWALQPGQVLGIISNEQAERIASEIEDYRDSDSDSSDSDRHRRSGSE